MPPRGEHGGPPPSGGRGASGFYNYDFGMSEAQSRIDRHRAFGRAPAVGGIVGGGYVPKDSFSVVDLWHRFQLARTFSLRRPTGVSRFSAFVGNYQVLSHDACRKARFDEMVSSLSARYKSYDIDAQDYGDRIMYEADRYYGWLRKNYAITDEEYRKAMSDFAESHGIDYDFGDSVPAMTR